MAKMYAALILGASRCGLSSWSVTRLPPWNDPAAPTRFGTPAAVSYEIDFAKALITGAKLGTHDTTDVLTLSISSTDILGHRVGPDSPKQREMVDAVDTDLDGFFTWLDKNVEGGLGSLASTGRDLDLGIPACTAIAVHGHALANLGERRIKGVLV